MSKLRYWLLFTFLLSWVEKSLNNARSIEVSVFAVLSIVGEKATFLVTAVSAHVIRQANTTGTWLRFARLI